MSWKNSLERWSSLKVKVTLSYALLFLISCSVIYLLVFYIIRKNLISAGDTETSCTALELEKDYLLGSRYDQTGELLSPDLLPDEDRALIVSRFPATRILYIYRNYHSFGGHGVVNGTVAPGGYTAIGYRDDNYYELRREHDGTLYSRRIHIKNNLYRLRHHFNTLVYGRGRENFYVRLLEKDGKPLLTSDALPLAQRTEAGTHDGEVEFRVLKYALPDGRSIEIGRNISRLDRQTDKYAVVFFLVLFGVTLAGCGIGWLMALHFISGVGRVTRAARQIYSGNYSHRIESRDEDREIRELIDTFNRMNGKTETLLNELRMVTDNFAHDLRTPLTRICGNVELALASRDPDADYQGVCVTVAEECERMKNMLDVMLEITRTNSRPEALNIEAVNLKALLSEVYELMQPLAEESAINFTLTLPTSAVTVAADKMKLQRLVANLLENALKFTPTGGRIALTLAVTERTFLLQVADSGCGIAEKDRPHIFKRFFRGDASRNHPGNGLGLALVDSIVGAHGWTIELTGAPGQGSTFTVIIPQDNQNIIQSSSSR